jgi:hypothetical protein
MRSMSKHTLRLLTLPRLRPISRPQLWFASMAKYRARTCPRCSYYVGFSIVKSLSKSAEACVTSFCLNCSYKLPIHTVLRGIRRATSPVKRRTLRLAKITEDKQATIPLRPDIRQDDAASIGPSDYQHHLRAIGQDLERLQLKTFNLECAATSYLIWARPEASEFEANPASRLSTNCLQRLWKNKPVPRTQAQREYFFLAHSAPPQRLRYSLHEIDRIEHEGRCRRSAKSGIMDGHSLSQLLRTIGALVAQRGERLLGIAWQELSVSIVVQTAHGRRELDTFRPDNLYDLWVRMYLKRDRRALSDVPQ